MTFRLAIAALRVLFMITFLAGSFVKPARGQNPIEAHSLLPVQKLIGIARKTSVEGLPIETRQSYPLPVIRGQGIAVEVLYTGSIADPLEGLQIEAPSYHAFVDARTGRLETLERVTPQGYGQPHEAEQIIGTILLPPGMTAEQFLLQQARLYELYDVLMPVFAAGRTKTNSKVRLAATEFKALFPTLAEAPLLPYYHAAGKAFFAWVEKTAL